MSDAVKVEIEGLKELEKKLRELGPKLGKNALRSAVNAGAQVVKRDAIERAPEDTGRLKRALYVKQVREESSDVQQTYFVGVRQGKKEQAKDRDAWYWRFLEFGTVNAPAKPFLRPAFEATKNAALERIKSKLAERIERLAK